MSSSYPPGWVTRFKVGWGGEAGGTTICFLPYLLLKQETKNQSWNFSNYYRIGKYVENEFQEIGVRSNFFRYYIFFASDENRTDMKMQRIEMQKKICFFVGF